VGALFFSLRQSSRPPERLLLLFNVVYDPLCKAFSIAVKRDAVGPSPRDLGFPLIAAYARQDVLHFTGRPFTFLHAACQPSVPLPLSPSARRRFFFWSNRGGVLRPGRCVAFFPSPALQKKAAFPYVTLTFFFEKVVSPFKQVLGFIIISSVSCSSPRLDLALERPLSSWF